MKCPKRYQITGMSKEEFRHIDRTQVLESVDSPTQYVVTFRYYAPERSEVAVIGDWMFSDQYHSSLCESGRYWPHEWKKGYFPHTLLGLKQTPKELTNQTEGEQIDVSKFEFDWEVLKLGMYEMEKDEETGIFSCTIPLPSGTFNYRFVLDMPEGNPLRMVTIPDPNVPGWHAPDEEQTHSQVRVPYKEVYQIDDRSVELPVADERERGRIVYEEYPTNPAYGEGDTQMCAVYLPAHYDEKRTDPYPVLYLSHGGSDRLSTWLNQGSLPEMMDHLILEKKARETVVVLLDCERFKWNNLEKEIPNLTECVMPYIENKFHVTREKRGRAFAGLSAGGFLAFEIFASVGYLFEAIGIWSGGRRFEADLTKDYMREVKLHLGAGRYDDALFAFVTPLQNELVQQGIKFTSYTPDGAHQWSVWRKLFCDFMSRVFR